MLRSGCRRLLASVLCSGMAVPAYGQEADVTGRSTAATTLLIVVGCIVAMLFVPGPPPARFVTRGVRARK